MSFIKDRHRMVDHQLRGRGIRDVRVLEAMDAIPRECFIEERHQSNAYGDAPVGIGFGQTISQPYMTALMCQELRLRGDEIVLDVGTGSGYHAAVLAALAAHVYSIEVVPELCSLARDNLACAGLGANITLVCGDGSEGYPKDMSVDGIRFQAISIAAAAPAVPHALLEQLADPGRLVIPVGSLEEQDLQVITKVAGRINTRVASACRFVPLIGKQGWPQ